MQLVARRWSSVQVTCIKDEMLYHHPTKSGKKTWSAQCLRQVKDPGHPWMNRACARLPVFSSFILYSDHQHCRMPQHCNLGQFSLNVCPWEWAAFSGMLTINFICHSLTCDHKVYTTPLCIKPYSYYCMPEDSVVHSTIRGRGNGGGGQWGPVPSTFRVKSTHFYPEFPVKKEPQAPVLQHIINLGLVSRWKDQIHS